MARSFLTPQKKSSTDVLETASKREIQKTVEWTSDLLGNKIADKFMKNTHKDQITAKAPAEIEETLASVKITKANIHTTRKVATNYWWTLTIIIINIWNMERMEYNQNINLLDSTIKQPSKIRTKNYNPGQNISGKL